MTVLTVAADIAVIIGLCSTVFAVVMVIWWVLRKAGV